MIWCRFETAGRRAYGMVQGSDVVEVDGSPFTTYSLTEHRLALDEVRLLVPCEPGTIYTTGGVNYRAHLDWSREYLGVQFKEYDHPEVTYRSVTALRAPQEPIAIPKDSTGDVHYEGELTGVIGRQAKHLSLEEAQYCVLGYTICNDVSERTWQRMDATLWRAKNADTFKPVGPWIVTDFDPAAAKTLIRINGNLVSEFATGDMIFDLAQHLVELTRYVTVYPGDLFALGTDGATVPALKPGDVVEVEITGLGTLRNPIVSGG